MKKRQELWWFAAAVFVATAVVWWRHADAPPNPVARPMVVRDNRSTGLQFECMIVLLTNSTDENAAALLKQIESGRTAFKELGKLTSSWRTNISQVITSRSRPVPSPFQNIDMPRQPELKATTNSAFAVNAER